MTAPQFDYVIVGGGSAGATLANRLSADPRVTVCLLEAGGDGRDVLIRAPMAAAIMLPGKPLKVNNWAFETTPQVGLKGRRGYQPRGKALGGSSAINAMLYVRGQREDYEGWRDWAVRAGALTMYCPTSSALKTTSVATANGTAQPGLYRWRFSSHPVRFPRHGWKRRCSAALL